MVSKTGMTILDYFQLAGIKTDLAKTIPSGASPLKTNVDGFRQILATTGKKTLPSSTLVDPAETNSNSIGMNLADYFKAPLPVQKIMSPASASESKKETAEIVEKAADRSEAAPESLSTASRIGVKTEEITTIEERINASIEKAAAKYGLPHSLIRGVIKAESNFQVNAVSSAGAQGLMQLMPATARELGVRDAFDIEANVDGGTRYLKQMLDKFGGELKLALAAYNSGPGTVQRYGRIPPYRETQAYVDRVMQYIRKAS